MEKGEFNPLNKTIFSIVCFGKTIQFNLTDNCYIISGLGMSGNWRISDELLCLPHKHLELVCLKNNKKVFLSYVDPRRFGFFSFLNESGLAEFLKKFGVDPTSDKFTP